MSEYQPSEKVLRDRAQAVRDVLDRHDDGPMAARDLGGRIGLKGSVESIRRAVRAAVTAARELGLPVIANHEGYWMGRDEREWRDYQEARKRELRFDFVRMRKATIAVSEKVTGQGKLFNTNTTQFN